MAAPTCTAQRAPKACANLGRLRRKRLTAAAARCQTVAPAMGVTYNAPCADAMCPMIVSLRPSARLRRRDTAGRYVSRRRPHAAASRQARCRRCCPRSRGVIALVPARAVLAPRRPAQGHGSRRARACARARRPAGRATARRNRGAAFRAEPGARAGAPAWVAACDRAWLRSACSRWKTRAARSAASCRSSPRTDRRARAGFVTGEPQRRADRGLRRRGRARACR